MPKFKGAELLMVRLQRVVEFNNGICYGYA